MDCSRLTDRKIGNLSLPTPIYFPSISSVKTALKPIEYLKVLASLSSVNRQFLMSAFDLANIEESDLANDLIEASKNSGVLTLMDSGNYESYWTRSQSRWNQSEFHKVLKTYRFDIAFGFDEQSPPDNVKDHLSLLMSRWQADQEAAGNCKIIPIIHGHPDQLSLLCSEMVAETGISMVAIPERKLGDGILERAQTLHAIRTEIDESGRDVAIHLLGTGNPASIAFYSAIGANSFDGLEWCQTVIDHETGLLYHLSQSDFFEKQTNWSNLDLSFHPRTLAHNLEFYKDWIARLRNFIKKNRVNDFLKNNLSDRIFNSIEPLLP